VGDVIPGVVADPVPDAVVPQVPDVSAVEPVQRLKHSTGRDVLAVVIVGGLLLGAYLMWRKHQKMAERNGVA